MSKQWKQASGVMIALVLSSTWLCGCGGNVTADDRRLVEEEDGEYSDRREESKPSLVDRLLGDRTRDVTVPSGTTVMLRWSETVSSRGSAPGDSFRTTVDEDVTIDDAVAIPSGSVIVGRVTEAHQPKVGGRARLALEFTAVELPSGESAPIDAVFSARGKGQNLKDAGIIAGSTVGGAILGEAVSEGEGGVIGGILGGIGGAVAASRNKARPVEIPAGSVMAIELVRPVTLEVPA